MARRTDDIVSEDTFVYTSFLSILLLFVPYYSLVMMVVTLVGASLIELLKYLAGYRPQYSVCMGIATCAALSHLLPFYLFIKVIEFLGSFDVKHLDLTGDICRRPSYYSPIALAPVFLVGNMMIFFLLCTIYLG